MKNARSSLIEVFCSAGLVLALAAGIVTAQTPTTGKPVTFKSPEEAAEALILAAEKFDVAAFQRIFGSDAQDIILTGETAHDKEVANAFAAQARTKNSLTIDPSTKNRAYLVVGGDEWPFPVPIVKRSGLWVFDTAAGRQELLYRRIGGNELDAIEVCRGYVEAQHEYALKPQNGVNQYAQRVISTAGKQDGLAWQNADGTWEGPIGRECRACDRTRIWTRRSVSWLLLQGPDRAGTGSPARRNGLRRQGHHDRRVCPDRITLPVRRHRGDDPWLATTSRLREGPGTDTLENAQED